jgi:hypothetical protein
VRLGAIAIALALLASARVAIADKPWAVGVSAHDQDAALALYRDGNALFADDHYKDALVKYEQALALWDHPAIQYNAAICLINLDRPLDAYVHLEAALRDGAEPIGEEHFKQGQRYRKLLARQVAELEVSCSEPGAEVRLDGKLLFVAPGTTTRPVLVGEHHLVASKPRFQTETRTIVVAPGNKLTIALPLALLPSERRLARRWNKWTPWIVVASGAAIAAAGVPLYLVAQHDYDKYDSAVAAICPQSALACPDPSRPDLQAAQARALAAIPPSYESNARLASRAEIAAFAIGGAIAATGFVMVVLDQPRLVAPTIGPERVGVIVEGRW